MTPTEKAQQELQSATERALGIIKNAEQEAKHTLAGAAADALKVTGVKDGGDHDLMIELRSDIRHLGEDVNRYITGTEKRIYELDKGKANQEEFEKLKDDIYTKREQRIRALENKVANYWIAFTLYSAAIGAMIWLVLAHIFT